MMKRLEVLFEDEDILVVIKPEGILSQGDRGSSPDMVSLLKSYLVIEDRKKGKVVKEEPYIAPVHRLDRNVRGVMVFAKTKRAAGILSEGIKQNSFFKKYYCVVGLSEKASMEKDGKYHRLESFLSYDKVQNRTHITEKGDRAILDYRVVKVIENRALIEVILQTGRHHQIRIQMTEISDGILGDRKYYRGMKGEGWTSRYPSLECVELAFSHPTFKERMTFRCDTKGEAFQEFL